MNRSNSNFDLRKKRIQQVREQEKQIAKQVSNLQRQKQQQNEEEKIRQQNQEVYEQKINLLRQLEYEKMRIQDQLGQAQKEAKLQQQHQDIILKEKEERIKNFGLFLILEEQKSQRNYSAKQWLEEQQQEKRQKEQQIDRKIQIKLQEQKMAHEIAQKYRENNPIPQQQEYDHFQLKKGKKLDVEQFNFINSRIVKHDMDQQQSAIQIAIKNEEELKIALLKKQEKQIQQQKIKQQHKQQAQSLQLTTNLTQNQQIQTQQILNDQNSQRSFSREKNKQIYAESIFEKQFLQKNEILSKPQNQLEQKKILLEKRKAYGEQILQQRVSRSQSKEKLEILTQNKNQQNNNANKVKEQKNINQQKQKQVIKVVTLENLKSSSIKQEQNYINQPIENLLINQDEELIDYEISESQNSIQKSSSLESIEQMESKHMSSKNIDDYIKSQEEFLQQIEKQKEQYEREQQQETLQDKILKGHFEISNQQSDNLIQQFLLSNDNQINQFKEESPNQPMKKNSYQINENNSQKYKKSLQFDTSNQNASILDQPDKILNDKFLMQQKNPNIKEFITPIKQTKIQQNTFFSNKDEKIFQTNIEQDISQQKLQSEFLEFFDENQNISLAERFKQRKKNISQQNFEHEVHKEKAEKKQKTKEELIEYRKQIMKSKNQNNLDKPQLDNSSQDSKQTNQLISRLISGEKTKLSTKEMKSLTNKNFNLLPEQIKKREKNQKQEEAKIRKEKMKEMSQVKYQFRNYEIIFYKDDFFILNLSRQFKKSFFHKSVEILQSKNPSHSIAILPQSNDQYPLWVSLYLYQVMIRKLFQQLFSLAMRDEEQVLYCYYFLHSLSIFFLFKRFQTIL